MLNKKTTGLMAVLCVVSAVAGFYSSAAYFKNVMSETKRAETAGLEQRETEAILNQNMEEAAAVSTEDKITPSTKMVYEYYYTEDGVTEREEAVPPYFMLDLTLNDLVKYYEEWTVISFSPREVVMRRVIDGKSEQQYIIGEYEGYVAVFYAEEIEGIILKELTSMPVSALSEDERLRLSEGIVITGNDELIRAMESYES